MRLVRNAWASTPLVLMLCDPFDIDQFEAFVRRDSIDRTVRPAEPDRPMSAPDPFEGLVVIARNPSDSLQAFVLDGIDSTSKLDGDVIRHPFEILLGPPAQPDRPDHDRIVHH